MLAQPLHPIVIEHGRVGDMIMLTALLSLLHRRYGKPCHVVGAGPWNDSIFLGHPDVAHCWTLPRHAPFPATLTWLGLVRALRRTHPGPVYVAEFMPRQTARIKRLLAVSGIDAGRCVLIDERPGDGGHWIEALLRLGSRAPPALSAADYPLPDEWERCAPRLAILPTERAARDAWMRDRGWTGRPVILVQPGTARTMSSRSRKRWRQADDRSWSLENWRALLHAIRERCPQAVLVLRGAVSELPLLREAHAAIGLPDLEIAALGLRASFALLEAAHSMISMDTGLAHAAAALGLPVVVLLGSNPGSVILPRGAFGSPVIGVGGPPTFSRAAEIPVRAVFDAWCSLPMRQKE